MKKYLNKRNILIFLSGLILLFILTVIFTPINIDVENDIYSKVILDSKGDVLRIFLNRDEQWLYSSEDQVIPEKLKECVLAFEDKWFYYHLGIDPFAITRAMYLNIKNGNVVSGGSTITMQLARLLSPKRRTFLNKIFETFQSIKLEFLLSKEEILKKYLQFAPYGRNIIGYQTASLKYFDKSADQLSWSEAALLAVLPNSPGQMSPGIKHGKLVEKRDRLLKKMNNDGTITDETLRLSLAEKVNILPVIFPKEAPHLTRYLKNNTDEQVVHSTLNIDIQKDVEQIVKRHSQYLQGFGINNIAVLVAETETGKVRAYMGSQDFWDDSNNGKVDGIHAPRSSGSILKPFLYAKCIDEGLISEEALLADVPVNISTFTPKNANDKFSGLVKAKDALARSLNIPAVILLKKYGLLNFYQFLKESGISTLFRQSYDYGLPLIIGGAEVTLFDMVSLFRGLGNYGKFSKLTLVEKEEKVAESQQLISEGAAYITLKMLENVTRPGVEYFWNLFEDSQSIAWKTGTSYGHKDAWAIGVNPRWTIGAWVGNFSGEGNTMLGGAKSAGPVLFDIFNLLKSDEELKFYAPIGGLKTVDICKVTGYLASKDCPETKSVFMPTNSKPLRKCPYHDKIFISADETEQVCSLCWEEGYKETSVLRYPPLVSRYLRLNGKPIDNIPPHRKTCSSLSNSADISIVYPINNLKIFIPREYSGELQKVKLDVAHSRKDSKIYWYIDEIYYGSTIDLHSLIVTLDSGDHVLKVVDSNGISDSVKFVVNVKVN
ncbi:MAG: penicillin-binding protein 1C [Candidatus Delongbacteria bacterium]|jgi:penicillin-binding protein 1C|nr:penicillin-binding protein 1C [Candidatus Delongbacteria bacterium]